MPYVFFEELPDGAVEASVVDRTEYDTIIEELDNIREQRDIAIDRAEVAERGLRESKEKYANTFLSKPFEPNEKNKGSHVKSAQSVKELFNIG